ncbi:ribose 5-phosphate isomerase B [Thermoanaerobacterium sp. DL9XJH110]|uniref:ribose 5-phosphate isomerase B n=1 Tax=Thermoanaerobacterium sp. DL9XJH110 TaxID=3386643 RepID=UPI003BB49E71
MKIAIGSDHAGYDLKEIIKRYLDEKGISHVDFGTFSPQPVDFPEFAMKVAESVVKGECNAGILFCGTGIGMSIAANKAPGIRAAVVSDTLCARYCKEHNNANVICLGGRIIGSEMAKQIVDEWLKAEFMGGRHQRRLEQVVEIELKYNRSKGD